MGEAPGESLHDSSLIGALPIFSTTILSKAKSLTHRNHPPKQGNCYIMFAWFVNLFRASHVDAAIKDLEAAKDRLEMAIVKESDHLLNFKETEEKVIAKTTEIQRVIKEDYERLVKAESERFEAVKAKVTAQIGTKANAVAKGEELLAKIKAHI